MEPVEHEKILALRETFSLLQNWEDKYSYVIDLGKDMPAMLDDRKNDNTRIYSCMSSVWVDIEIRQGNLYFTADSESQIVKGLLAIVREVYSGQSLKFVNAYDIEKLLSILELKKHITPQRGNGLRSIIKKIKEKGKVT